MATFTSTLPDALLAQLAEQAKRLSVPKNKLIERALAVYLEQLKRAEYIRSYKKMADDTNLLDIAEEGMVDYCTQLDKE
jgi:predicted transcriptional regulator